MPVCRPLNEDWKEQQGYRLGAIDVFQAIHIFSSGHLLLLLGSYMPERIGMYHKAGFLSH